MNLTVDAPCGRLQGIQEGEVAVFRNIPYAAPPVGDSRFSPPEHLAPWDGLRQAAISGYVPPQGKSRLAAMTGGEVEMAQSEDCLTLDVTRGMQGDLLRPVLVWIHGGGFMGGAGSHPWYRGDSLATRGDIIVVSVNYRQGVLGHLCLPGVSPGNLALLDVVSALRWVHENIASFGGDQANVTVGGQSSGASLIAALLSTPSAEGLFHRAILQSPPLGRRFRTSEQACQLGMRFADILGVSPSDSAAFRSVTVPRLLEAQGQFVRSFKPAVLGASEQAFGPVVDGHTLLPIEDAWLSRSSNAVDILIGSNKDEQSSSIVLDESFRQATKDDAVSVFNHFAPGRAKELLDFYAGRQAGATPAYWLADFYTDVFYRFAISQFIDRLTHVGARVWHYRFDWTSPAGYGSCHCLELPFVFGTLQHFSDAPMLRGLDVAGFVSLSGQIQDAWLRFVRKGNPMHVGGASWQAYDGKARAAMSLGDYPGGLTDALQYESHPLRAAADGF